MTTLVSFPLEIAPSNESQPHLDALTCGRAPHLTWLGQVLVTSIAGIIVGLLALFTMLRGTSATPTAKLPRARNYRSIVAVPMLKDGYPIGSIAMARSQSRWPSDRGAPLSQTSGLPVWRISLPL